MTISQILTIEQVSELLNVRPSWIYQRTADGNLRGSGRGRRSKRPGSIPRQHPVECLEMIPHFKVGRLLRFDKNEVLAWFAKLHRGPESSDTQPGETLQRSEPQSVAVGR